MAVEILAGLSVDHPEVMEIFAHNPSHYVSRLFSKLADQPSIAALAWDALINLAIDSRIALHLYDTHRERLLACCESRELVFTEAATKLLANLTKHLEVRPPAARLLLPVLLPLYMAGPKHNTKCDYAFLASAMADLTNIREGRLFFVEDLGRLERLLPDLHSVSLVRRGGITAIIKNCLFETNYHEAILAKEKADDFIITTLAGRLLDSRSQISAEEREKFPVELQLLDHLKAESDIVIRSTIIECLIILAMTRAGRDTMHSKQIYPILREWHRLEPVADMKLLIEKMVELLIRDEEIN